MDIIDNIKQMLEKYIGFSNAQLADNQANAIPREVARQLAKIALFELKGIDALHPTVKPLAQQLLAKAKAIGINLTITETFRTAAKQNEYYEQGRTSPGSVVTNAKGLQSYHNYALAFDVAFDDGNGNLAWPVQSDPRWQQVATLGETLGLTWGGSFGDYPHWQYDNRGAITWQILQTYFNL